MVHRSRVVVHLDLFPQPNMFGIVLALFAGSSHASCGVGTGLSRSVSGDVGLGYLVGWGIYLLLVVLFVILERGNRIRKEAGRMP